MPTDPTHLQLLARLDDNDDLPKTAAELTGGEFVERVAASRTEAESLVMGVLSIAIEEQLRAERDGARDALVAVTIERDDSQREFVSLCTQVDEWRALARAAKSGTELERTLYASLLVEKVAAKLEGES